MISYCQVNATPAPVAPGGAKDAKEERRSGAIGDARIEREDALIDFRIGQPKPR